MASRNARDPGRSNSSTVYAHQTATQIATLSAKARRQRAAIEARRGGLQDRYGTAMSGVINQKMKPLEQRLEATSTELRSLRTQAQAMRSAARVSNATYAAEGPALQSAGQAQLQRVREEMAPGLATAAQSIKDAKAYAARIGVEMQGMDIQAKYDFYAQIVAQNNAFAMTAYQNQLQIQNQQRIARIQQREATRTELAGSSQVVTLMNQNAPDMLRTVQQMTEADRSDSAKVEGAAAAWAGGISADPAAQTVLIAAFKTVALGIDRNTAEGVTDGNWLRTSIVQAVHTQYPHYTQDSEIETALSDNILEQGIYQPDGGGFINGIREQLGIQTPDGSSPFSYYGSQLLQGGLPAGPSQGESMRYGGAPGITLP